MHANLEELLHFYSTRKKDFDFNLKDVDLMLKFETYFELKTMNETLNLLLEGLKVTKGDTLNNYYERLYRFRLEMFGDIDEQSTNAADAFLQRTPFHDSLENYFQNLYGKKNQTEGE